MDFNKLIKINENSRVPKYQQIVDSIIFNITVGNLKINQKIPSINEFSEEFYISRDTVERAYNTLKKSNIIVSIRGKGFYINQNQLIGKRNILFLINKLSVYKLKIYNSFVETIGTNAHVELLIYYCDENLFLSYLEKNILHYDYFVVMPHFKGQNSEYKRMSTLVKKTLNSIPNEKLFFLDNAIDCDDFYNLKVFQDFNTDLYEALKRNINKISKYQKFVLIFPKHCLYPYPVEILNGFRKFCKEYNIAFDVTDHYSKNMILNKDELFLTIEESDLVELLKQIRDEKFLLGDDVGVISYNDTPLKELLGITVVSTDFKYMGATMAEIILGNKQQSVKVPFRFIDRKSM